MVSLFTKHKKVVVREERTALRAQRRRTFKINPRAIYAQILTIIDNMTRILKFFQPPFQKVRHKLQKCSFCTVRTVLGTALVMSDGGFRTNRTKTSRKEVQNTFLEYVTHAYHIWNLQQDVDETQKCEMQCSDQGFTFATTTDTKMCFPRIRYIQINAWQPLE